MELTRYLSKEESYFPWYAALANLNSVAASLYRTQAYGNFRVRHVGSTVLGLRSKDLIFSVFRRFFCGAIILHVARIISHCEYLKGLKSDTVDQYVGLCHSCGNG